jgi:hypothetical protein
MGYGMTSDPNKAYDLAVKWRDATISAPDAALASLCRDSFVVNASCHDISKSTVDRFFQQVFGYGLALDATTHEGPCVQKSELNAQHDGRVIQCPVASVQEGYVYQKLIDNTTADGLVQDLRVPVINGKVPFVYIRYHRIESRFHGNVSAKMVETEDVLSAHEIASVLDFSGRIGLDYGEIDILRDNHDGRIYVVDVNNTPFGPPVNLERRYRQKALQVLAAYFAFEFLGERG